MPQTIPRADLQALFGHCRPTALEEAAQAYLGARMATEEAERALKQAQTHQEASELRLLREMEAQGIASHPTGGARLDATTSTYYALPEGGLDDSLLYAWLVRNGGRDLVRRVVHSGSFTHFCRKLEAAGRGIYPGVKKVQKRLVRLVGGKDDV